MKVSSGCFLRAASAAGILGLLLAAGAASAATPQATSPVIVNAPKGGPYPKFGQVPPAPRDVRPLSAWRSAVIDVQKSGRSLAQRAAAEPWTLSGTEAWAADARARVGAPPPAAAPTVPKDAGLDAEVAAMRARAKEPPRSRQVAHP